MYNKLRYIFMYVLGDVYYKQKLNLMKIYARNGGGERWNVTSKMKGTYLPPLYILLLSMSMFNVILSLHFHINIYFIFYNFLKPLKLDVGDLE